MSQKIDIADVSVVMPAFNAASTIDRAIKSIARQTVRPRELIVVDDGSIDSTVAIVMAAAPYMNDITLRVFRQQNQGPGAARNQAVRVSAGQLLAFLDADDEWLPNKLERSLEVLRADNLTMVAHDILEISANKEQHVDCRSRWLTDPSDPFRTLYLRGFISSSTVVVRRADVLEVGGFDPTLASAQDYDLWLAILSQPSARFALFGEPLLRYNLTTMGITGRTEARRQCNERILHAHIPALRSRRGGSVARLVALRASIIQFEAMQGHWAQSRVVDVLRCITMTPWVICRALLATVRARPRTRDFLRTLSSAKEVTR